MIIDESDYVMVKKYKVNKEWGILILHVKLTYSHVVKDQLGGQLGQVLVKLVAIEILIFNKIFIYIFLLLCSPTKITVEITVKYFQTFIGIPIIGTPFNVITEMVVYML